MLAEMLEMLGQMLLEMLEQMLGPLRCWLRCLRCLAQMLGQMLAIEMLVIEIECSEQQMSADDAGRCCWPGQMLLADTTRVAAHDRSASVVMQHFHSSTAC